MAETECESSLDCVGSPAGAICDPSTSRCEECVKAADCEGTAECIGHRCVPFTPCETSLECGSDQVCYTELEQCVECVRDGDCLAPDSCLGNQCKPLTPCESDRACTPLGQLCDLELGVCADCMSPTDCGEGRQCLRGACSLAACVEGAGRCTGDLVEQCRADSTGWETVFECTDSASCAEANGLASCVPWQCGPSAIYCSGAVLRECAADGLSSVVVTDCGAAGLNCVAGECTARVCDPNSRVCDADRVLQCDALGGGTSIAETCTETEYCDPLAAACVAMACTPDAPACDGLRATVCNSVGSGYLPGGTACTAAQGCSDGQCGCPPVVIEAEPIPVDMYIALDDSGSMGSDCNVGDSTSSKWCYAVNALDGFFRAPSSVGLGVALNYINNRSGCTGLNAPPVGLDTLPAHLTALTNSLNSAAPTGITPIEAALRGIATYTVANRRAGRQMIGILVTDGSPQTCSTGDPTLRDIARDLYTAHGIPTFMVGMTGAVFGSLETWASESGVAPHTNFCGSGVTSPCRSYDVGNGDPTLFLPALQQIQAGAAACRFVAPAGAVPSTVQLLHTPSGGSAAPLTRVLAADQCAAAAGAGWYFDDNLNPVEMRLCADTCTLVGSSRLDVEFPCAAPIASAGGAGAKGSGPAAPPGGSLQCLGQPLAGGA